MKTSPDPFQNERERLNRLLKTILQQAEAQEAFDQLIEKGCDQAFLENYLTDRIEPDSPIDDAESRKADLNLAKSFKNSLEKTRDLMVRFSEFSGEPFAELSASLSKAYERVQPWTKPRPVLLFSRRQYQQFRLLERVRGDTGRWHEREVATLLDAVYSVRNIPEEYPTEESLHYLVSRFKDNRTARRKGL